MAKVKKKIFSITASDCEWQYFRGSGDGGQKKQKTSSAARCIHKPSGAVGEASDSRNQFQNRKTAFQRMFDSKEFQSWMKLQIDIIKGNIKYEEVDETGQFVERDLVPFK